jgi:hypothetical protein
MKTYHSVLPAATRRSCQAEVTRDAQEARQFKARLTAIFANGFWYCFDCQAVCERIEGEQGQPSHCDRCGSTRIEYNAPAWADLGKETV